LNAVIVNTRMNLIHFITSIPTKLILKRLRSSGYSSYSASILLDKWYEDIFSNKKTTITQKIWAHKRGFFSDRIAYLGLTDQNFTDYLSDFDYFWLHPINGAYGYWIDDKLTIKYILQPFGEYLPEYYYHVYNGEILRLMDCPDGYGQTTREVINLLKAKGVLAAKLVSGSGGEGFYKLAHEDHGYFVNNLPSNEEEVQELIGTWLEKNKEEYLITEYIFEHREMQKIYKEAPGTLRILVTRERLQSPGILFAKHFFPTRKTGLTTNGKTVACNVDICTGCFSDGITFVDSRVIDCKYHPDTNVLLEGTLPNWGLISEKIVEICKSIPQVRYMGFDMIITNDGFKIIEINSFPGIGVNQHYCPHLKEDTSKYFYNNLFKEKKAVYKG